MSTEPSSPPPTPEEALLAEHEAIDREEAEMMRLQLTLPGWLKENPGLSLTLLYLFGSAVGILFHYHYLRRFGFDVREFSEATDFLMVVVREPLTVALALLGVPVYVLWGKMTGWIGPWSRKRFPALRSTPEKRRASHARMRPWFLVIQIVFIAVYANVFVLYYSGWRAKRIRAEDPNPVTVHYKTDSPDAAGQLKAEQLTLLASTSRYVFFYDRKTNRSEVVPVDAIARLVWDARTRKQKAADVGKE